jgi:hypothetical protein
MPLFSTRGRKTVNKKSSGDYSSTTNNYLAYDDPDEKDDVRKGFDIGSVWINNDSETAFICVDNSKRNAVWKVSSHQIDDAVTGLESTWSSYKIQTTTTELEDRIAFLESVIRDLTGIQI